MIILNLVVFNKKQITGIVNNVLKNKWALNVIVGNEMESYFIDESIVKNHSGAHIIQFATKSLLFEEIEASLKKEFPGTDFYIFANPIVHINAPYYDNIKNQVTGVNIKDKENEKIIFTKKQAT